MVMKRAVAAVLCWAALAIAATAQTTLSKEERDFLTNYLRESQLAARSARWRFR